MVGHLDEPATVSPTRGIVTIVVPAYNVERYLDPCLTSLRRQTAWPSCRVLVIDDGSTDQTAAIAADAASDDAQVRLVSQANQGPGPGAARNRGLDLVSSEFVMFLDGDDELTPTAVELLRTNLTTTGADLAVGASEQFPTSRRWLWTDYFSPGRTGSAPIEDVPLLVHNAATGNKMFRTDWLREGGWRFAVGIHHQDTVVTVPAMLSADRLGLVGDVVHRYRKRAEGGSIMDSHYTRMDNYWDHLQVIEALAPMLADLPAERRALLETFIARSFQGFACRAPGTLATGRLPEFFDRSRAVISRLSSASILTATRDAGERAAYVTMLENDLATFRDLDRHRDRLVARRGDLYLDLPTSSEERRGLLKTAETRAVVHDLTLTADSVELALRVRVRGARDLVHGLNGLVLRLLREDGGTAPARELFPEPAESPAQIAATVRLSAELLSPGRHLLRLGFRTWTGQTARWVRLPRVDGGDANGTRLTVLDVITGRRFSIVGDLDGRAVLEVATADDRSPAAKGPLRVAASGADGTVTGPQL